MNSVSAQKYLSFETKRSFLALLVQEISIFKDYFSVNLFRKMAFFMKMAYCFQVQKIDQVMNWQFPKFDITKSSFIIF